MNITDWWLTLTIAQKIYWCIAAPFTLLFVLQMVMTFFGGGAEDIDTSGDSDLLVDNDTGIDYQFITLKNLIAFFAIFGWTGVACLSSDYSIIVTVFISFVAGLIMMAIMASIIYFMAKLSDDGTLKIKNSIGKSAIVYLPIPPKRTGSGKVQIKVQGLQTLDAMTDCNTEIRTGSVVEVVDIINGDILLVK
jgi:hypothetical protein